MSAAEDVIDARINRLSELTNGKGAAKGGVSSSIFSNKVLLAFIALVVLTFAALYF